MKCPKSGSFTNYWLSVRV